MQNQQLENLKEQVYNLMCGSYDLEQYPFQAGEVVCNEFEDGRPCAKRYQAVYDANRRLCERLGVDEDNDVEQLINHLMDIARILSMAMFDYGQRADELLPLIDNSETGE